MPVGGPNAVASRVAPADDHHILVRSEDVFRSKRLVSNPLVLLGEEVHREMNPFQRSARYRKIARLGGADGEDHRVVLAIEIFGGDLISNVDSRSGNDALFLHNVKAPSDDPFL